MQTLEAEPMATVMDLNTYFNIISTFIAYIFVLDILNFQISLSSSLLHHAVEFSKDRTFLISVSKQTEIYNDAIVVPLPSKIWPPKKVTTP